jgi:hypothetical protein
LEVCTVSLKPSELTGVERPALRVIDGGASVARREGPEVVAEVLSDGTIRVIGGPDARADDRSYATGQVSGDGWSIWWDRRYWS